jgi:O-succinylbenzoic acid--CoA ligase
VTPPGPADWPVPDPLDDPSPDLLSARAASTPDAPALVDADTGATRSYAEFDERVRRRVAALGPHLDPGSGRIGLLLDTSPAFAEVYFAAERTGTSVVPLNLGLPAETLRHQAERTGVDCLVAEAATGETASGVAPPGTPVASVDTPERDGIEALDADPAGASPPADYTLGAERVVLFTSGTTGDPKGVRLTRRNLVASAVGSAYRLGVEPGDRWLVCLPMYHMGGLAPLVRSTLYGTTTVLQHGFDVEATAAVMAEYGVTGVSLVPTMLHRLLDAGWHPPDSLRFVLLGGAPASASLLERALDRDVPVYPTYGATETASQVATATPGEVCEYPGTVGRSLRGTQVSIRDPEADRSGDPGAPLGPGERGEIVVSGPTVSPGYLDDDRTARAFDDSGFHTGDLGHRDEAGRLWVVGRLDDRIVTGGENVYPAAVADALTDLSTVAEAAVVGLPDEEWGQRVAALVVLSDSADRPDPSDICERLRGRVADYALPKTVGFADELPRTASGTVDREAVCERLESSDADR